MSLDPHSTERPPPGARHAPATGRNREPILEVLQRSLPEGLILEIACGTGEHAIWFAPRLPGRVWQPTDASPDALVSARAWVGSSPAENLRAPIELDVSADPWPVSRADGIVCVNMIHISPWSCTEALMRGAGRTLSPGGVLYLYGPYRVGGRHTAPSNARFEGWLKGQDPRWGVRDVEAVIAEAAKNGLAHAETVDMPANNKSVVFRRG